MTDAGATDSHVAMLRGAIALAWEDGLMDEKEQDHLHELIDRNQHLNYIQRDQLKKDILKRHTLDGIWDQITDKHDRAHLINIAVSLFHEDGSYCELERRAYEQINRLHHDTLDVESLRLELGAMAAEAYAREEEARKQEYESLSPFRRALRSLDALFG